MVKIAGDPHGKTGQASGPVYQKKTARLANPLTSESGDRGQIFERFDPY